MDHRPADLCTKKYTSEPAEMLFGLGLAVQSGGASTFMCCASDWKQDLHTRRVQSVHLPFLSQFVCVGGPESVIVSGPGI